MLLFINRKDVISKISVVFFLENSKKNSEFFADLCCSVPKSKGLGKNLPKDSDNNFEF